MVINDQCFTGEEKKERERERRKADRLRRMEMIKIGMNEKEKKMNEIKVNSCFLIKSPFKEFVLLAALNALLEHSAHVSAAPPILPIAALPTERRIALY